VKKNQEKKMKMLRGKRKKGNRKKRQKKCIGKTKRYKPRP
jgi:hypothetical protein